ncbi:MAG: hypothetical protein KC713_02810, partial [Candidatus Omnitrophica bacterium]|nr:hypothetical protein [Candidatus Omnitrophota bacterium]
MKKFTIELFRKIICYTMCLQMVCSGSMYFAFAQGPLSTNVSVKAMVGSEHILTPTSPYTPTQLRGIAMDPINPLNMDFIIELNEESVAEHERTISEESLKLVKYFMASLTVPEDQLWVNLSPYEKNRVIPENLGATLMGRDLLQQDYILKQFSASMMYPDNDLGKKFWERLYKQMYELYGQTDLPVDTFHKIWIVPDKATVIESEGKVFLAEHHLKVMLEKDYLAYLNNTTLTNHPQAIRKEAVDLDLIREVIIPQIEKEVNTGRTFSKLRQIYQAMILATWFKHNLKGTFLGQVYVDQSKTVGVEHDQQTMTKDIYQAYVGAFQNGVFDFVREDFEETTQELVQRRYVAGGMQNIDYQTIQIFRPDSRMSSSPFFPIISADQLVSSSRFLNLKVNFMENLPNGFTGISAAVSGDNMMQNARAPFAFSPEVSEQQVDFDYDGLVDEISQALSAWLDVSQSLFQVEILVDNLPLIFTAEANINIHSEEPYTTTVLIQIQQDEKLTYAQLAAVINDSPGISLLQGIDFFDRLIESLGFDPENLVQGEFTDVDTNIKPELFDPELSDELEENLIQTLYDRDIAVEGLDLDMFLQKIAEAGIPWRAVNFHSPGEDRLRSMFEVLNRIFQLKQSNQLYALYMFKNEGKYSFIFDDNIAAHVIRALPQFIRTNGFKSVADLAEGITVSTKQILTPEDFTGSEDIIVFVNIQGDYITPESFKWSKNFIGSTVAYLPIVQAGEADTVTMKWAAVVEYVPDTEMRTKKRSRIQPDDFLLPSTVNPAELQKELKNLLTEDVVRKWGFVQIDYQTDVTVNLLAADIKPTDVIIYQGISGQIVTEEMFLADIKKYNREGQDIQVFKKVTRKGGKQIIYQSRTALFSDNKLNDQVWLDRKVQYVADVFKFEDEELLKKIIPEIKRIIELSSQMQIEEYFTHAIEKFIYDEISNNNDIINYLSSRVMDLTFQINALMQMLLLSSTDYTYLIKFLSMEPTKDSRSKKILNVIENIHRLTSNILHNAQIPMSYQFQIADYLSTGQFAADLATRLADESSNPHFDKDQAINVLNKAYNIILQDNFMTNTGIQSLMEKIHRIDRILKYDAVIEAVRGDLVKFLTRDVAQKYGFFPVYERMLLLDISESGAYQFIDGKTGELLRRESIQEKLSEKAFDPTVFTFYVRDKLVIVEQIDKGLHEFEASEFLEKRVNYLMEKYKLNNDLKKTLNGLFTQEKLADDTRFQRAIEDINPSLFPYFFENESYWTGFYIDELYATRFILKGEFKRYIFRQPHEMRLDKVIQMAQLIISQNNLPTVARQAVIQFLNSKIDFQALLSENALADFKENESLKAQLTTYQSIVTDQLLSSDKSPVGEIHLTPTGSLQVYPTMDASANAEPLGGI